MEMIVRKSVAFQKDELARFDKLVRKKGRKNRSDAIRALIREALVNDEGRDPERRMMATLTIVYDHHNHDIQHELTHLQHGAGTLIVSTMHTHMDARNCLEVIVLRGKVKEIKRFADLLLSTKGVQHGRLVLTDARRPRTRTCNCRAPS